MTNRPITTLFMLVSVDGKITTGMTDNLDFDIDLPLINYVNKGLHQYYEIEQTTDLWSLNSGRVQAKIGVNTKKYPQKSCVSFVIIDNKHLTEHGVNYFCHLSNQFVLVTTNKKHPAFLVNSDNMHIILQDKLDLKTLLKTLKKDYACDRLTIQTGGTLNRLFLQSHLFDYLDLIIAPVLVGGKNTSSLIDGYDFTLIDDLKDLGILKLISVEPLQDSYIRLKYQVINNYEEENQDE